MDPSAAETTLRQHPAAAFGPEQMVQGNAHVVVAHVIVRAGAVQPLDARGALLDDEDAVLTHHEEDVGGLAEAGEPLLTVDHPLVALLHRGRLEQRRVAAALRFGHRERRPDLLVHEREEPPLLLFGRAVRGEDLHVAGVGPLRPEDHRGRAVPAEDLVDQRELELAEAGASELLVEEQGPQPLVFDPLLERVDDGLELGFLRLGGVGKEEVDGIDLVGAELLDPVELLLEFRFGREVPRHESDATPH